MEIYEFCMSMIGLMVETIRGILSSDSQIERAVSIEIRVVAAKNGPSEEKVFSLLAYRARCGIRVFFGEFNLGTTPSMGEVADAIISNRLKLMNPPTRETSWAENLRKTVMKNIFDAYIPKMRRLNWKLGICCLPEVPLLTRSIVTLKNGHRRKRILDRN